MPIYEFYCADCHTANQSKLLRGDLLSQGHTNGYPIYALGDTSVRPLHTLLWHCSKLMRSTPFEVLSDEYVNLELSWPGAAKACRWRSQACAGEPAGTSRCRRSG